MKPIEWAMLVLLSIFWGGAFFFVEIALLGIGVLGEVIQTWEYAGMGAIFLGLMVIDGRVFRKIEDRINKGKR